MKNNSYQPLDLVDGICNAPSENVEFIVLWHSREENVTVDNANIVIRIESRIKKRIFRKPLTIYVARTKVDFFDLLSLTNLKDKNARPHIIETEVKHQKGGTVKIISHDLWSDNQFLYIKLNYNVNRHILNRNLNLTARVTAVTFDPNNRNHVLGTVTHSMVGHSDYAPLTLINYKST